jgi:hypothetical protein
MVIDVAVHRRYWNALQMSAILHGVEVFPDLPRGEETVVQLTGHPEKLQAALIAKTDDGGRRLTWAGIKYLGARPFGARDPEPERLA